MSRTIIRCGVPVSWAPVQSPISAWTSTLPHLLFLPAIPIHLSSHSLTHSRQLNISLSLLMAISAGQGDINRCLPVMYKRLDLASIMVYIRNETRCYSSTYTVVVKMSTETFLVREKARGSPSHAIRLHRHHSSVAPRISPRVLVVVASHAAKTPLLTQASECRMSVSPYSVSHR
jgi:hypothetical protein